MVQSLTVFIILKSMNYRIQPNKRSVLENNWAMKKRQGICSYKRALKCVNLDNKATV